MNAIGQAAGNQGGILAALLLPAQAPNAAPVTPAFLNLINLIVGFPEITVAPAPAPVPAPGGTTAETSSAQASVQPQSIVSSELATPVGQTLSKGTRMLGAGRTAPPKQIAGALMRAMLGNSTPNVVPLATPVTPPAATSAAVPLGISSSPAPAPVPVPADPPQVQTPAAATADPNQTQAAPPNPGPVNSRAQNVNPDPRPALTGLAFSLNLTPVNAAPSAALFSPAPDQQIHIKTEMKPEQPVAPAVSSLLPAALPIPPAATPNPAPQAAVPQQSTNLSPSLDRRPATQKLETAPPPKTTVQDDTPVKSNQPSSNHEPVEQKIDYAVKPQPVSPEPNEPPPDVAPPTTALPAMQVQAAPAATPQEPAPAVSVPNPGGAKSKPAAADASSNRPSANPAQIADVSDKDVKDTQVPAINAPAQTAPDPANNAGRTVEMRTPADPVSAQDASSPLATPYRAAADAIRSAEPVQPAEPTKVTGPVQDIIIRIAQPDTPAVDVHILDRAGQVQVAVRTPGAPLQSSLREDLGTLVSSLQRAGYRAETFTPQQSAVLRAAASEAGSQEDRDRQESHSGNSGGNPGNSSDRQQQHKPRDQRSRAWFEELEKQV